MVARMRGRWDVQGEIRGFVPSAAAVVLLWPTYLAEAAWVAVLGLDVGNRTNSPASLPARGGWTCSAVPSVATRYPKLPCQPDGEDGEGQATSLRNEAVASAKPPYSAMTASLVFGISKGRPIGGERKQGDKGSSAALWANGAVGCFGCR
jgi:hypothetical protein